MIHYCGHVEVFDKAFKNHRIMYVIIACGWEMLNIFKDSFCSIVSKLGTVCLLRVNDWYWFEVYPSSEIVNPYMNEILERAERNRQSNNQSYKSPAFSTSVLWLRTGSYAPIYLIWFFKLDDKMFIGQFNFDVRKTTGIHYFNKYTNSFSVFLFLLFSICLITNLPIF